MIADHIAPHRHTANNFNAIMARNAKLTIVEADEIVYLARALAQWGRLPTEPARLAQTDPMFADHVEMLTIVRRRHVMQMRGMIPFDY